MMRRTGWVVLIIFLFFRSSGFCQHDSKKVNEIPGTFCVSPMEYKLYTMINEYRSRYDLPPIPLSKSLSFVASVHSKDLAVNHPDKGPCNSHSWSAKGYWKPFCYPRDENKKNSVWDKPKELTKYQGKGYEIVYWENTATVIDSIITFWKSMDYFNSFLMNTGKWNGKKWNAIGISIFENYATAWFGELADPDGIPVICGAVSEQNMVKDEGFRKDVSLKEKTKTTPSKKEVKGLGPKVLKNQKTELPESVLPTHKVKEKTADSLVQPEILRNPTGRYYIIVKSQAPKAELISTLKELKDKGYADAKLLGKEKKFRVSVQDYLSKQKADSALREIRKTMKDAWILKF